MNILADSADHAMMIRSGPSDATVKILAHRFNDPAASRHAIIAAIEEALGA